jgi:hypothetical protein
MTDGVHGGHEDDDRRLNEHRFHVDEDVHPSPMTFDRQAE